MIVASSSVVASASLPFVVRAPVGYLKDRINRFALAAAAVKVVGWDQPDRADLGPADPAQADFE